MAKELTTTDLLAAIVEYDRIVRKNGTVEAVADDDTGEVYWEVQDVARVDLNLIVDDYENEEWASFALNALVRALQSAYQVELDHYEVEINNG